MTVVDPSVSTEASRRTSTPRRESRRAPIDKKMVRTSGNSSGTAEIPTLSAVRRE